MPVKVLAVFLVEVKVAKNDWIQGFRFFPRWGDEKYLVEEINAGILYEYFPTLLESMKLHDLSPDECAKFS